MLRVPRSFALDPPGESECGLACHPSIVGFLIQLDGSTHKQALAEKLWHGGPAITTETLERQDPGPDDLLRRRPSAAADDFRVVEALPSLLAMAARCQDRGAGEMRRRLDEAEQPPCLRANRHRDILPRPVRLALEPPEVDARYRQARVVEETAHLLDRRPGIAT